MRRNYLSTLSLLVLATASLPVSAKPLPCAAWRLLNLERPIAGQPFQSHGDEAAWKERLPYESQLPDLQGYAPRTFFKLKDLITSQKWAGVVNEVGGATEIAKAFGIAGHLAQFMVRSENNHAQQDANNEFNGGKRLAAHVSLEKAEAQLDSRHGISGQRERAEVVAEELYKAAKKANPEKDVGSVDDYRPSLMTIVDTITTKKNEGRGWMGIRFEVPYKDAQGKRRTRTNTVYLHIRMLDADGFRQQKQIGTIAANLAYAVAHHRGDPKKFIRSLVDDIDLNATGNPDLSGPKLVEALRNFAASNNAADIDAYVNDLLAKTSLTEEDVRPRYDAKLAKANRLRNQVYIDSIKFEGEDLPKDTLEADLLLLKEGATPYLMVEESTHPVHQALLPFGDAPDEAGDELDAQVPELLFKKNILVVKQSFDPLGPLEVKSEAFQQAVARREQRDPAFKLKDVKLISEVTVSRRALSDEKGPDGKLLAPGQGMRRARDMVNTLRAARSSTVLNTNSAFEQPPEVRIAKTKAVGIKTVYVFHEDEIMTLEEVAALEKQRRANAQPSSSN